MVKEETPRVSSKVRSRAPGVLVVLQGDGGAWKGRAGKGYGLLGVSFYLVLMLPYPSATSIQDLPLSS